MEKTFWRRIVHNMENSFLLILFLSLFTSSCSTSFKGETPNPQTRKTSGLFDDIKKGFQQTIDDMKNLKDLPSGESGRIHVLIYGLDDYLDDYNRDVLYTNEVTELLYREGNYEIVDPGEIADNIRRRKPSKGPVGVGINTREELEAETAARAMNLSDLGVLMIFVQSIHHRGRGKLNDDLLRAQTTATIKLQLMKAGTGRVEWSRSGEFTTSGSISQRENNYNQNVHGVRLKDKMMRRLVLRALRNFLPEIPKKR